MKAEDKILEIWQPVKPQPTEGQEIWKIAARNNEKPGRFTKKQVKSYKRVGLL
ncbi:hypothetical protein VP199E371_P0032 [Vibrio phage 199E37-1]|nr:hypothetical protein VP199E371_P0032 [Vibrio phage 199E37-1]